MTQEEFTQIVATIYAGFIANKSHHTHNCVIGAYPDLLDASLAIAQDIQGSSYERFARNVKIVNEIEESRRKNQK